MCYFTQDKTDVFDWTRRNGGRWSSNTGPNTDHTIGTSAGYYIYIEASPRKKGDNAILYTPTIDRSGPRCEMSFWYHMMGKNIGSLNIWMMSNGVRTDVSDMLYLYLENALNVHYIDQGCPTRGPLSYNGGVDGLLFKILLTSYYPNTKSVMVTCRKDYYLLKIYIIIY